MQKAVILSLIAVVGVASGLAGFTFGAGEAPIATSPGIVKVYAEHATTLLSVKKTEELIVEEICADAFRQATHHLSLAERAVEANNAQAAMGYLESAAAAAALIANEGDKAVAAVRNRLLEGGHHHHAKAEIAEKYDPGFVIVTKVEKSKIIAQATAIGKLAAAVRAGASGAGEIAAAKSELAKIYAETLK